MPGYPSIHRCVTAIIIIVTKRSENGSYDLRQKNQAIPNNTIPIIAAERMRSRLLVFPADDGALPVGWSGARNLARIDQ